LDPKKAQKKAPNWEILVKSVINNNDNKMITNLANPTRDF
jgi:hypothetical protein